MPVIDGVIKNYLKHSFFSNIVLETELVLDDWCIGIIKPLKTGVLGEPCPANHAY